MGIARRLDLVWRRILIILVIGIVYLDIFINVGVVNDVSIGKIGKIGTLGKYIFV